MKIIGAMNGSYPRIGDEPKYQELRKSISRWERGEVSGDELVDAYIESARMAIEEQVEAGLELVTDGLVRWYDPISHLAGKLNGVRINGLLRFFDTNCYFRQPVVERELERPDNLITDEFGEARDILGQRVIAVLTGPYTLARHSIPSGPYAENFAQLVLDYAQAIAAEVYALWGEGADYVQIDEPSLLKPEVDWGLVDEAWRTVAEKKTDARLILTTYFGDAAPSYNQIMNLGADIVGFDFTYSRDLPAVIAARGWPGPLALGLVDGRNTRLEKEEDLLRQIEQLLPHVQADRCYLTPSCGLEYLPRDRARDKLRILGAVARRFQSGVA